MGISRFNSEGYYDPTAHEAVCNIEKEARKWRPLVYICSPYSGDVDRNTEKARRYCRFAVDQGAIPLAAHLLLDSWTCSMNSGAWIWVKDWGGSSGSTELHSSDPTAVMAILCIPIRHSPVRSRKSITGLVTSRFP